MAERMRFDYSDTRTMDHIMRDIAAWFVDRGIPDGTTVAVEAIGRIGYETRLRILDTFGLASPEMVPLIRAETMSDVHVMHLLHPDYLVSGVVLSPEQQGGYRIAGEVLCPPLARPVSRGEWAAGPSYCRIYVSPTIGVQPVDAGASPHHDGQR